MKTALYLMSCIGAIFISNSAHSQIHTPIHWSYGIKKLHNDSIEIHLLAKMEKGWHIYAQKLLPEAIAIPTSIMFKKMPCVVLIGETRELGKKEVYEVKSAGVINYEYANQVDFVQKIKVVSTQLKAITGSITYQACTHQQCLPENTINFNIPIK